MLRLLVSCTIKNSDVRESFLSVDIKSSVFYKILIEILTKT